MKKQKTAPAQTDNQVIAAVPPETGPAARQECDEEKHRILRARAAQLAQEAAGEDPQAEFLEFTEFIIANERYGIENAFIREVYPLKEFTPLPGAPAYVFGIINVRGKILSVLDLRRFFNLQEKGLSGYSKVIIIHGGAMEFGILADMITGVGRCPVRTLLTTLPTLTDVRSDYLKGVTQDRMVLLDGDKLLNDRKIIVHEAI